MKSLSCCFEFPCDWKRENLIISHIDIYETKTTYFKRSRIAFASVVNMKLADDNRRVSTGEKENKKIKIM
jgi:hypothetical protein